MFILDFLKNQEDKSATDDFITCEYRLLCSGEIYSGDVLTTDWRMSDATRLILVSPFTVIVSSHPFNDYPQELALRFTTGLVTEYRERSISEFYPDEEIARDIAALLCLFCRRLVTVSAKVREVYPRHYEGEPEVFQDWPIDFVNSLKTVSWERHPVNIVYGPDGVDEIIDYNPKPKPVSRKLLKKLFLALPHIPEAESIIHSARLYALALERIDQDVDIAYHLLIESVETIANEVFRSFAPSESDMIKTKKTVADLATQFGLAREQADRLAVEACKGISWHNRKFVKFLTENGGDELWTEDDVFVPYPRLMPKRDDFESAVEQIYRARGKVSHAGGAYPASAGIGTRPRVSTRAMDEAMDSVANSKKPFPPIIWFERAVNIALRQFVERAVEMSSK